MRTRLFLLCATMVLAGTGHAQSAPVTLTPQAAFDRFLRVAATVGQPIVALQQVLPVSKASGGAPERFMLTAAHTVIVSTQPASGPGDGDPRISLVTWVERVADTVALRRRVSDVMRQLERSAGPVERCSDPLGPPAYLSVPQRVVRLWRRGGEAQPVQLVWEVGAGADYSLTVAVGPFADGGSAVYACDADGA